MNFPKDKVKRLNLVAENYLITEKIAKVLKPIMKKEITDVDVSDVLIDLGEINDDISSYVISSILTIIDSDNLSDKEQ